MSEDIVDVDFLVIGAGMAGASVAASLSALGRVAIVDMESHAGYHTTGRSAAVFSEIYGAPIIRAMSRASRQFLFEQPAGFSKTSLVTPRPTLYFARDDQLDELAHFRDHADIGPATENICAADVQALVPIFRPGYLGGGALERGSADIDVDALLQGFLRSARARKATIHLDCGVNSLVHHGEHWVATTAAGFFRSRVVVNAAGAWGDEVARMAGIAPIGLRPLRRSAALIAVPGDVSAAFWPTAIDISEQFYFKPDAGQLLLSPADEELSPPCDAQPEELDIAIAADRFEQATGTEVRKIHHRWAGLRVFAPDRCPVVGFDPLARGFFWLVGQGGYGIQTAPAMGRLAAALASGGGIPDDIARQGVTVEMLSRGRLGAGQRAASV